MPSAAPQSPPTSPSTVSSIRSVERALDLLEALERTSHSAGVTELARMTGMPKATAQRMLSVLESRGLIKKEFARYQLGPGTVPLARAFLSSDTITTAARPIIEQLAVDTGEVAFLYARDRWHRVMLLRVDSSYTLRIADRVGERLPLHLGAAGQTLLAHMPRDEIDRYLGGFEPVILANGDLLTRDALLAKLENVRRDGFAISYSERRVGVVSISAPIFRGNLGVVGSVGISGPPSRMPLERVEQLSIQVRQAATQISEVCRRM